jgi:hypothetical protein
MMSFEILLFVAPADRLCPLQEWPGARDAFGHSVQSASEEV